MSERPHYYNEIDPVAAAWLRALIEAGELPAGEVDERSIEDVAPTDLVGFVQCHFFAGIGGWPLALKIAGWPVDRPIWTGSCPCQPFSAAGKGDGFADERHLWPAFHWLIQQCRPAAVAGEQVASAAAGPWLDLVRADLEALGYAFGGVAFPAAGVGAPHIRDRAYWVGHANVARLEGLGGGLGTARGYGEGEVRPASEAGESVRLADAEQHSGGREAAAAYHREQEANGSADQHSGYCGPLVRMADAARVGRIEGRPSESASERDGSPGDGRNASGLWVRDPNAGHWRGADWLRCRDGRWRPVEPGTFPLAHGLPARVGRLRGYGNAIVPQQAAEFIRAAFGGG